MIGEQLEHTAESELVPYRRGISLREIVKGMLARFLPGSLLTILAAGAFFGVNISADVLRAVGGLFGVSAALTAGFGLGLLGLRRWLYPDAKPDGMRSFVAGLMSPFALFIAAVMTGRGWTLAQLPLLLGVVGVVMAVLMFFAWLIPTPAEMLGEGFEVEDSDETRLSDGHASS